MKQLSVAIVFSLLLSGQTGLGVATRQQPITLSGGAEERCAALRAEDFSALQDAPTDITAATWTARNGNSPAYCQVTAPT